jgi:hypothetical protein
VAEPNPRGARRHVREEGPCVEEARLVRVVLERHQVEAGPVRDHRQLDGVMRSLRSRRDERPEEQLMSIVHLDPPGYLSVFVATYFAQSVRERNIAARMGAGAAKPLPSMAPPLPSRRSRLRHGSRLRRIRGGGVRQLAEPAGLGAAQRSFESAAVVVQEPPVGRR